MLSLCSLLVRNVCLIWGQQAVRNPKSKLFLHLSSSAPLERYMLAFLSQGGGVLVDFTAEANFINCEITSNEASYVSTAI